jgi:acetamidase/formamidase
MQRKRPPAGFWVRLPRGLALAAAALAAVPHGSSLTLSADYHVPLTPETAIIGHFSATKAPVISVPSGAIVSIDGGGGVRWENGKATIGDAWLKENGIPATLESCPPLRETARVLAETPRAPGIPSGHLLVGPVYVQGAEPGDTLEVRILDVSPRIPYGTVVVMPGKGGLADSVPHFYSKVVLLDLKRNAGIFDGRVEVPLAPFMGVMATCPPDAEGPNRKSGPPGAFGGNLDCKALTAGSSLYLPVFQKGALFYTGDSHAAQGDGEVTISAIETANTCILQFIVHKGMTLKLPRAETATHFLAFGLDPDLNRAMRQAILETISVLKEKEGYDFFQAYALASIGVDFHVTQVVDGTQGVHGMIPKRLFVRDRHPYWYRPN